MERQTFEMDLQTQVGSAIKVKVTVVHDDRTQAQDYSACLDVLKGCASNPDRTDTKGSVKASQSAFNETACRVFPTHGKLMTIAVRFFLLALALAPSDAATKSRRLKAVLGIVISVITFPLVVAALKWYAKSLNLDLEVDFLAAMLQILFGFLIAWLMGQ